VLTGERKDGSTFPVEVALGPVLQHHRRQLQATGNDRYFVAVLRDMSWAAAAAESLVAVTKSTDPVPEADDVLRHVNNFAVQNLTFGQFYGLSQAVVRGVAEVPRRAVRSSQMARLTVAGAAGAANEDAAATDVADFDHASGLVRAFGAAGIGRRRAAGVVSGPRV
jgi:hypothetical protein